MQTTPLTPHLGVQVDGVDLATLSAPGPDADAFVRLLWEHGVVVVRDQELDRETHKELGRRFGPLHVHPSKRHPDAKGDKEIFTVKAGESTRRVNGGRWHSDVSCDENGVAPRRISPDALDRLSAHDWPGNVRQLRNVIERMVVLSSGDLDIEDVPEGIGQGEGGTVSGAEDAEHLQPELAELLDVGGVASLKEVREAVERAYIVAKLKQNAWNVSQTAIQLGLERSHLHRKMRLYKIERGGS